MNWIKPMPALAYRNCDQPQATPSRGRLLRLLDTWAAWQLRHSHQIISRGQTDNATITQTFTSGTSDFLRFSFLAATTNFATSDTLFVYDGATISAPLIAAYTAGSMMETFTSKASQV